MRTNGGGIRRSASSCGRPAFRSRQPFARAKVLASTWMGYSGGIGRGAKCTHIVKFDQKSAVVADLAESACCAQRRDRDLPSRARGHKQVARREREGNIGRQGQRRGGSEKAGRNAKDTRIRSELCLEPAQTRARQGGHEVRTPARGRAAGPRGARGSGGMSRAGARSPSQGCECLQRKCLQALARNKEYPTRENMDENESPWASASAHSFTHAMTPGGLLLLLTPRARPHARTQVSSGAALVNCCHRLPPDVGSGVM